MHHPRDSLATMALASVCGLFALRADLACGAEAAELYAEAARAAAAGESETAVRLASEALRADSSLAAANYLRGREHFRLGKFAAAVADFDRYVELRPELESRQWERGIAYYYTGQFAQGARQFELYQSYHDRDVENSVWRLLCMVPTAGVAEARAAMLPIAEDRRVPMMQIYDLFRGKLQPEEVKAATRVGQPNAEVLAGRQFYAHLYLGLYYVSTGHPQTAQRYLQQAAAPQLAFNPRINRYMWDVARIHAERLSQRSQPQGEAEQP